MPERKQSAQRMSHIQTPELRRQELSRIQLQQNQEAFQLQQAQRQELLQVQQQQAQELRQLQQNQIDPKATAGSRGMLSKSALFSRARR